MSFQKQGYSLVGMLVAIAIVGIAVSLLSQTFIGTNRTMKENRDFSSKEFIRDELRTKISCEKTNAAHVGACDGNQQPINLYDLSDRILVSKTGSSFAQAPGIEVYARCTSRRNEFDIVYKIGGTGPEERLFKFPFTCN